MSTKRDTMLFTDALSLNIFNGSLLTAVGDRAYLLRDKSITKVPHKSHYKKIHGYTCSEKYDQAGVLLLYGENEFSLFSYDRRQKETFTLLYEGETKDWINAAIFFKDCDVCQFVLHMAHSSLLHLQYSNTNNTLFGECNIIEQARCTDYSMLYHTSLYGKDYKKLIIISGNAFGEVLFWQPHDPVISNSSTRSYIYPLCLRLKAHNGVIFSIDCNLRAQLLVTTSDDRSLKFWKLKTQPEMKLNADFVKPMFSCFGHTARVTCARIVEYGDQTYVISGGEDSYVCVWNQAGEMLFKRRHQFGAPIWRIGFDPATATIYTTGSTGNVLAYDFRLAKPRHPIELKSLGSRNEFMKKIKFLDKSTIVGLTNRNHMFYMRLDVSDVSQIWKPVSDFPTYKCTVLTVHDGLIATCGYQRVTLLSYSKDRGTFELQYDGEQLGGLIQSFHFLSRDLYLISDEHGNCRLLKGYKMNVEGTIRVGNSRESWITAALLVKPNYLLISCRNGNVMLLTWQGSSDLKLWSTLKGLHGKMGSIVLKLTKLDSNYAYILSAGHESAVRLIRLSIADCHLSLLQRKCVPLAWIEAMPTEDIVIGFNDNHLVVWSHKNDVILQLQCGGGHRCWDYQLNNEELEIVYIKQNYVYHHRERLVTAKSDTLLDNLRSNWHIRNCNIMQLVENEPSDPYIVSGGDDNIIKINQLIDGKLHLRAELHTHISSVRHLVIYPVECKNEISFWLIFSVGGRSQLCISKLEPEGPVASELCSHTLRSQNDNNNILVDARLMSINVTRQLKSGIFCLYVASADGKIRLFHWQPESPMQLLMQCTVDIERCPLQLQSLPNLNLIIVSTSNGMLYGFDETLKSKRFQHSLHAAGINVFEALGNGTLIHILSGGDDESVRYTIVDTKDMVITKSMQISLAHNAQIAALALRSVQADGQGLQLYGYTCSMDKQIYMINLRDLVCTRVDNTCISDISGMLLIKDLLLLYGCGLQAIRVETRDEIL